MLKKILQRNMYQKWYGQYAAENKVFWDVMIQHEQLQRKLLP
jgi:hypothetical protein